MTAEQVGDPAAPISYGVVTLTRQSAQGSLKMNFPAALSRALAQRGYDKVEILVTADGILLKPFASGDEPKFYLHTAALPEWK